ncbi:MAG: hypothetical protein D4R81_04280 [Nitrospiraceae bacterium]|nr:MAG: hypothetical protein D4R81_04280 [Nitrospiraceae bacterium]
MIRRLLPGVLVLLCAGCAGPTIASRATAGEANWFVRLDTFMDSRSTADLRFNHPAEFSETELAALLSRVQVQERAGILEQKPFPRPLFSPTEIRQMAPGLQKALRSARPAEWAAFYSALPGGVVQEITSGGLFVQGGKLHVVVANHHERIPTGSNSLAAIRANPLSPWGGKGVTLSFDPPRFVAGTQATWLGGSAGAPASELVLDHSAFLAEAPPTTAAPVAAATVPPAVPQSAVILPPAMPLATPPVAGSYALMKEQLTGLQSEVERLRRRLEEQDEDIALLKTRIFELDALLKSPPRKKPAR